MPYRQRPTVVEAFQWTGQPRSEWPEWATEALLAESGSALYAYTKLGPFRVSRGDWCVLGDGEIIPFGVVEFHKRYEAWMPAVKPDLGVHLHTAGHDELADSFEVRDSEDLDDGA